MTRTNRTSEYDVIVIGAGPSGLLVADKLTALGVRALVLEAGPARYPNPSLLPGQGAAEMGALPGTSPRSRRRQELAYVAESDWRFKTLGSNGWWARAHALGGRGNLWGGWLQRFDDQVFQGGGWPLRARDVGGYYDVAELWLGAVTGKLDVRYARARRALGLRFVPGTFATRLGQGVHRGVPEFPQLNSVALRIVPDAQSSAVHVLHQGRERVLRAKALVLACSPIETTRLLLESELHHPWLGRRLTDHHMLGYVLFEPNRAAVHCEGLIAHPTAIVPHLVGGSGQGTYSLELLGPVPSAHLKPEQQLLLGVDAARVGGSATFINAIGEQRRHPRRKVTIAPRARDTLGRRIPEIHFAWSAADRRIAREMKATCRAVAEAIASPGAELVRCRDPFVHPAIYHPAGTCAMGSSGREPCAPDGKYRNAPNLWIADASVFPSGGDGHPTLTVLAHALRVADSVALTLGKVRKAR